MFMDHAVSAARLVNELMLVSVLVAGEGAEAFSAALAEAGAAAEALSMADPGSGYDLAVLLGAPDPDAAPDMHAFVQSLSAASERLLLVPLPPPGEDPTLAPPSLPELTRWFEIFAELGYQPVVDFDASFVAAGAFLVDRGATAAESELAAFADRLQSVPSQAPAASPPLPEPALRAELDSLHERLAEHEARALALSEEVARHEAALHAAELRNAGWDGLRDWVNAAVRDPARDTEAALRHDLPVLALLRGSDFPPIDFSLPSQPTPKGWLRRLFKPAAAEKAGGAAPLVLEETAQVRASTYFDPAWYIASTPELCGGACIDPVFHYVLVGAARGADPGPWFDTAAYRASHPESASSSLSPLAHAIRAGAPEIAA